MHQLLDSKMSKSDFVDGICFNSAHNGLLSVDEERLLKIIKKEPIADTYHVEHTPFARGKFAAVRKCTHKETGVEYAAKFIRKRRRAMDQRQDILHEVAVLKLAANNTRIVRLHEVYETPSEMALVLEMASGGELQHVLDAEDGIPEVHAVKFMRQIIEGLNFLHGQNIAHLDLKPQNLLLTGVYPDCDIKLCDFGISRIIQNGVEVREILGTPDYVAPEILSYEPISLATDIWSVGVLAYVLLSGYSPFGGDTKQETFCNISQCCLNFPEELFEGVSSTAKEFIQATLVKDPSNRLTSQQCLEHPWLSGSSSALTNPSSKELALSTIGASSVEQEETDGVKTSVVITEIPSLILEASRANGIKSSHSLENGISCSRKKDDGNETKTTEGNHHAHSDDSEELPVNKRPKNSPTHYPVASCLSCAQCGSQCCHIHKTPRSRHQHHHSSITNSPVEITVDRAIIC